MTTRRGHLLTPARRPVRAHPQAEHVPEISSFDDMAMQRCLELARAAGAEGNYALGALVLLDGAVIAESGSSLIGDDDDPSAHPEMTAIRAAAHKMSSRYLEGAVLFTTLEPCPMCTSAAIWAKMDGIVYGASQTDAAEWSREHPDPTFTWRQIMIPAAQVAAAGTPRLHVRGSVRRDECRRLFAATR